MLETVTPPPRPCLRTLAPEISANIVALVRLHEDAWNATKSPATKEARERHVNTLHALPLTCKDRHGFATKHIFEVRQRRSG